MKIVPDGYANPQKGRVEKRKEIKVRPFAILTTFAVVNDAIFCAAAWLENFSLTAAIIITIMLPVLIVAAICCWRFERPRVVHFESVSPPPHTILHINNPSAGVKKVTSDVSREL